MLITEGLSQFIWIFWPFVFSIANMNAVINPPVIQKFRSEVYIICVPEIFHINVSLQNGQGASKQCCGQGEDARCGA